MHRLFSNLVIVLIASVTEAGTSTSLDFKVFNFWNDFTLLPLVCFHS